MTPRKRSHPRRLGYTLIELIVVVVMVASMMAIALPRLRISAATEVQLAGMQLAQDLDLARTRALSARSLARVTFMTSARTYTGYLDDDADGMIAETQVERDALHGFATRTLPANINYGRGSASAVVGDAASGTVTFPSAKMNVDSRGLIAPTTAAGTVYLVHQNDPTAVVAVAVSPAGNMRLWTWRAGGWQ